MNTKVPCGDYESIILFGQNKTDKKQIRVGDYYISKTYYEILSMLKSGVQPMLYWQHDEDSFDFYVFARADGEDIVFCSTYYAEDGTIDAVTQISINQNNEITVISV